MSQPEVFLRYFVRCEVDLRALVGAALHDVHAREEVFQEIALTLWQRFSQYDPSRPFGAWARGVAARLSPTEILRKWQISAAGGVFENDRCPGKLKAITGARWPKRVSACGPR